MVAPSTARSLPEMARWRALVCLPDFPTRQAAEAYAEAEYSRSLVEVISVASDEIGHAARASRERRQQEEKDQQ